MSEETNTAAEVKEEAAPVDVSSASFESLVAEVNKELDSRDAESDSQTPESEAKSTETAKTTGETPKSQALDFWNPSTWGEKKPDEVVKEIQRHYNENQEGKLAVERENKLLREQLQHIAQMEDEVLRDPTRYEAIRREKGLIQQQESDDLPDPDFSKVREDDPSSFAQALKDWQRKIQDHTAAKIRREMLTTAATANKETADTVQRLQLERSEANWRAAGKTFEQSLPEGKFTDSHRTKIVDLLKNDPSFSQRVIACESGQANHVDVIREAYRHLFFDELVESEIQRRSQKEEEVKNASTNPSSTKNKVTRPKRRNVTTSWQEEAIAEIDAELARSH